MRTNTTAGRSGSRGDPRRERRMNGAVKGNPRDSESERVRVGGGEERERQLVRGSRFVLGTLYIVC